MTKQLRYYGRGRGHIHMKMCILCVLILLFYYDYCLIDTYNLHLILFLYKNLYTCLRYNEYLLDSSLIRASIGGSLHSGINTMNDKGSCDSVNKF